MIDIKLLRDNPELVKESVRKRGMDESIVDRAIELDIEWRRLLKTSQNLRKKRNELSIEIGRMQKIENISEIERIREEVKKINEEIAKVEALLESVSRERDRLLLKIPNIIHPDVPIGFNEESNKIVRVWGKAKIKKSDVENFLKQSEGRMEYEILNFQPRSHVDILPELDQLDLERAAKISGARFYFLKNQLVQLQFALIRFALDSLIGKGYELVDPPYMIRRDAMEGVEDLGLFEEMLYKIEGEDLYLIATAEHPVVAMFMNEVLEPKNLPIKIVAISPCFRKEAGAHGKDTKGIFRVHQFYKVEQVIFCKPEDSDCYLEEVVSNAEELYQKLNIPYRVVEICSGELGIKASRKYDIEAWFPVQGKFREVVSASNCTDYQARRLMIRYRTTDGFRFVHIINSTAIAIQRTLVAIVENYQNEDGSIEIPAVLRKYVDIERIERPGRDLNPGRGLDRPA